MAKTRKLVGFDMFDSGFVNKKRLVTNAAFCCAPPDEIAKTKHN
jgi:hypothetical protein